ncbi:uncharacterized protein LOC122577493 [Bombus pyrosoma]|uniref:uncharacterized protein LOC122577492 n=1 Tax=Bombus pyrosoma TaxID=396416 RepID=UPI001CB936FE|nr:uncharacterized protein LOC122577492 [Bombus pyrosoma]XP_043604761.1 uncharacterized protein LOC122577493 [Bombus pyrosoma]
MGKEENKVRKDKEERMRREGEAELAVGPTQVSTRSMRKAIPPKEGFVCSASNAGNSQTEEATKVEVTSAVEAPRAKKRKTGGPTELPTERAKEMEASTTADIGAELIHQTSELTKMAETARNLKGTQARTLKEVATTIVRGVTEMARRADPASGALAIMEERIAALEAENDALRKELASRSTIEKSSETARLDAIDRKIEELGSSLAQRMEERIQSIEKRIGKEAAPEEITRRDPEEPETPATATREEEQATATEWQTVEGRRRKKMEAAGKQPAKITPRIRAKSPRKALEGGSKNALGVGGEQAARPLHTTRTSAVTITLKDRTSRSYAEVLAEAKDNVSLAEVGISTVRMRKALTGGVVLEVPEDQKREKAAALAARLTQILDPSKVRVATPFRAAEARVIWIDISATKEDVRNTLAKEGGCRAEDIRLGETRLARNGLGSVWMRGPVGAVRKLAQAGRIAIGWSMAKVEAIERRPLQCYKCLETGHVSRMCTSKEDRGHLCYRCGDPGHQARACTAANPKCLICEALGAPSVHRMGGPACAPPPKKKAGGITRRSTVASGSGRDSLPQGADPEPASREAGTEEATEAKTLGD